MSKCAYDDCIRRAKHYGLCYAHYLHEWKRKNGKEYRPKSKERNETTTAQEMRWARRAYANATSTAARIEWRRRIVELEKDIAKEKGHTSGSRFGVCEMCGADVELNGHKEQCRAIVCGEECLRARLLALAEDRALGLGEYVNDATHDFRPHD